MSNKEESKEFTTFVNAISVGWHLKQADLQPMKKEEWEKFTKWMERHNLKK